MLGAYDVKGMPPVPPPLSGTLHMGMLPDGSFANGLLCAVGPDTDNKPLLSRSTTEEFNSPQFFHGRPKSAEDENCPLCP
eukprot:229103-Pyramimonas_sp.AAC.1